MAYLRAWRWDQCYLTSLSAMWTAESTPPSAIFPTALSHVVLSIHCRDRMASRGTFTTWEVDLFKPHEVQQHEVQCPAPGLGQSQMQIQAGQGMEQEQPWVEEFFSVRGQKSQHDPAVCTSSQEIQPYLGLNQKQHGQQVEGGDSALLLGPCKTPPGVLHWVLWPLI